MKWKREESPKPFRNHCPKAGLDVSLFSGDQYVSSGQLKGSLDVLDRFPQAAVIGGFCADEDVDHALLHTSFRTTFNTNLKRLSI
ncbi:hypothetical protein NPIL_678411 [Nephila pilipes]|uniref:Uncharacterized protein n=1 Tax=Nephila pilipes TaxID=299642 RepID=A0A8X6PQP7_NEPPI|nr:hypothetical protein NPIL_678411 [Nephila pilipes]